MALNSQLNIQVRVFARQAQAQLAAIEKQVAAVEATSRTAAGTTSKLGALGASSMIRWGSQTQWAGRQLIYNFTIPLAIAGGAATKWSLENQAAMVRVKKVYGDASMSMKQITDETNALAGAFRVLSDMFGVQQKDVINIAADWAAAGASGIALAKATKLTLQTMILGEMNAADATKALIAIQAQYGMSTSQLSKTIDTLNMVENQTGTTMADLITVMSRTASTARSAGVDARYLAAMTAALVPAAGTAAQAGNALKTILSRVMSPTSQAAKAMEALGINIHSTSWESANGVQRLNTLAKAFEGLTSSQKVNIATLIAGRYQLNRFDVLMRAFTNSNSFYHKALNATSDATKNYAQKQRELNQVLQSAPQQFKQTWVMLQNMMTQVFQPLIPIMLAVAQGVRQLAFHFTQLNPVVQKWIAFGLLALALLGPLLRQFGALTLLVGYLAKMLWLPIKALKEFGLILVEIGQIAGKFILFILSPFEAFGKYLAVLFRRAFLVIWGWFADVGALAASAVRWLFTLLVAPFKAAAGAILDYMLKMVAIVGVALGDIAAAIFNFGIGIVARNFKLIFVEIGTTLLGGVKTFGTAAMELLGSVGTALMAFMDTIGTALVAGWQAILGGIGAVVEFGGTIITRLWAAWQMTLATLTETFEVIIIRLWGTIETAIYGTFGVFATAFARLWVVLTAGLETIWATFTRIVQVIWTAMWTGIQRITAFVGGAVGAAIAAVGTFFVTIWESICTALVTVWRTAWEFIASGQIFEMIGSAIVGGFAAIGSLLTTIGEGLLAILASPWTIAIGLIVALLVGFATHIGQIWKAIVNWFNAGGTGISDAFASVVSFFHRMIQDIINAFDALPQGVQNALMAVVRVVASAAQQVYTWLSYLNPFAKHSPSIVDSSKKGMKAVSDHHKDANNQVQKHTRSIADAHQKTADVITSSATTVAAAAPVAANAVGGANGVTAAVKTEGTVGTATSGVINKAISDMKEFRKQAGGLIPSQWAQEIKDIKKQMPSLMPMFNTLLGDLHALNAQLNAQGAAVRAQQKVVDGWNHKLDQANKYLTAQQALLDKENKKLSNLQGQYDKASQSMSDYANAPIKGMQKFSNEIFNNDLAQKKLQLRIDKWTDKHGDIDSLNTRYQSLRGTIETLQGEEERLRSKGAGSEILGKIQDQIDATEKAADSTKKSIDKSPIDKWQAKLAKLSKRGDELQLMNDIKFGPLQHHIENLANTTKELTYSQIIHGIKNAKARMDELTPKIKDQTKVVNDQTRVVNRATAARDRIQHKYDAENAKLSRLQKAYDKTKNAIDRVTSAMQALGSAASSSTSAAGKAGDNILGGKGNFPEPGGKFQLGGKHGDQAKQIREWTKKQQTELAKQLGKFDMFGPIKKGWNKFTDWMKTNIGPVMHDIGGMLGGAFLGIGRMLQRVFQSKGLQNAFHSLGTAFKYIGGLVKLFAPDFEKIGTALFNAGKQIWKQLLPALGRLWKAIWPLVKVIGVVLIAVLKYLSSAMADTLGPTLTTIINLITDAANILSSTFNAINDVFSIFVDLLHGNVKGALKDFIDFWKNIWGIFYNAFKVAFDLVVGVFKILWGVVRGFVDAVVGFFKWLKDTLVGHSIIPDMVHAIVKFFNWLIAPIKLAFKLIWAGVKWAWENVGKPVFNAVVAFIKAAMKVFSWIWDNIIKPAWHLIWDSIKAVWNNVGKPLINFIKIEIKGWSRIFQWIWGHIIRPAWHLIWNTLKSLWNRIGKPIFHGIKTFIKTIMGVFNWIWTHIIRPAWHLIWNTLKSLWTKIGKPVFNGIKTFINTWAQVFHNIWSGIKTAWNAIWGGIQWIWNHTGAPIFNAIKTIIGKIHGWFNDAAKPIKTAFTAIWTAVQTAWGWVKDKIFQPVLDMIGKIVNAFIGAVNFIINGINGVAGLLHLGFHIDKLTSWTVPKLEAGGKIKWEHVGAGFKTDKPRAIVGEGRGSHPEYVIPTDPRHRRRARGLYNELGRNLNQGHSEYFSPDLLTRRERRHLAAIRMMDAGGVMNQEASNVIGYAIGQLGKPYSWDQPGSWGVRNPSSFDCSGLTGWSYFHGANINYPHSAAGQYGLMRHTAASNVGPGGLLFYGGSSIHHVAMALGGNQLVEAPERGVPVRIRGYTAGESDMNALGGIFPGVSGGGITPPPAGGITDAMVNADIATSSTWLTNYVNDHRSFMDKIGSAAWSAVKKVGGFVVKNALKAAFWPVKTTAEKMLDSSLIMDHFPLVDQLGDMVLNKIWTKLDSIATNEDKTAKKPDYGHGYKVDRYAPIAMEVLYRMMNAGSYTKLVTDIMARVKQESGGDPNAINLTDSNAKAGTPSKGIMQVIQPTFDSYRNKNVKDYPNNIWDPRANMYAGLGYAKSRYGSIDAAMTKKGGYQFGTAYSRGGFRMAGERGPELTHFGPGMRVFDSPATVRMISQAIIKAEQKARGDVRYGGMLSREKVSEVHHEEHHKHINVHIDKILLPEVHSEFDAEIFIRNLESLADGAL